MEYIIQQNAEKIMLDMKKELDMVFDDGNSDLSKIIKVLAGDLNKLGREILEYMMEGTDVSIKDSDERKKVWNVQAKGMKKTLITKFGQIEYERTYYKSKHKKETEYTYLVDDVFGIDRYQRMDKGLEAEIIDLTKDYSYQKSVEIAVEEVNLSRQTAMNKIRKLGQVDNSELDEPGEKRKAKKLYVEADEDHIALQNGKNKITKLVYVHEGYSGKENELKNVKYFSGIYSNSEELWLEVIDYITEHYEVDKIETTYLAGDGAAWIKEGINWLPEVKYVLDGYHLNKYVMKATGHLPKKRFKLWEGLNACSSKKVREVFAEIMAETEEETKKSRVRRARSYIYKNWEGIVTARKDPNAMGCSAEGHVSHVLASRMSSRPMGWSLKGADQLARLRAFKYNGGDQKQIYEMLMKKDKQRELEIKTEKIINRKKVKTLYPGAKETVPALSRGKVTGLFRLVKSLAY